MIQIEIDDAEVRLALRKMEFMFDDRYLKSVIEDSSVELVDEIQWRIKDHDKPVNRYLKGGIRKPGEKRKPIATYYPGNLGRSWMILNLRKMKSGVVIGGKTSRNPKGHFRGKKVDGYYGHFVHEGTVNTKTKNPFVEQAWKLKRDVVYRNLLTQWRRDLKIRGL